MDASDAAPAGAETAVGASDAATAAGAAAARDAMHAVNAFIMSPALGYRSRLRLAVARRTMPSISEDSPPSVVPMGGRGSFSAFVTTAAIESPSNGRRPVSTS